MEKTDRFTRREWLILCTLGSVNFACALCVSLQAPFFPREAEKKGAPPSEYGLVFGVYELVAFISCPIYGKYMDKFGAKKIINFGILLAGISSICFGLLDLIGTHVAFISLAFLVRILESLGTSAAITASFSITAVVFEKSIATTFSVLKVFFGLGFMLGPTCGGLIFQIGGFIVPFLTLGLLMLFLACLIFFALPDIDEFTMKNEHPVQVFSVVRLLPVFLDLFCTTSAAVSTGFILAILEPHIRQFNLTPVGTGSIFMINSASYALTSPLVGYLCDTRIYPKKIIIIGGMLIIAAFSLIGPFPYVAVDTVLWLVCLGLVVHGLGYSCILAPSFIDAIHNAVACGLPNNMALYGVISGLAQSSFALGDTIGPSVGGLLYDAIGFRKGTLFVIAFQVVMVVAMTSLICAEPHPVRKPPKTSTHALTDGACGELTNESAQLVPTTTNKDYGS